MPEPPNQNEGERDRADQLHGRKKRRSRRVLDVGLVMIVIGPVEAARLLGLHVEDLEHVEPLEMPGGTLIRARRVRTRR
jgi:hypothetical protein